MVLGAGSLGNQIKDLYTSMSVIFFFFCNLRQMAAIVQKSPKSLS